MGACGSKIFLRPGVLKCRPSSALSRRTTAIGCLQDVHWFSGSIGGAFQSYTIGNILSAQLYAIVCKTHPQIPREIEVGEFCTLHDWLKNNLYRHGRKYRPNELIERLVGGLSAQPYLAYLRAKFGEIYRL